MKQNNYLKTIREKAGLSQNDVATQLGWSTPQLCSNFERGICLPPHNVRKDLAKLYRVSFEELDNYCYQFDLAKLNRKYGRK